VDPNFKKGFEKSSGAIGILAKQMPKVFKWATHAKGKFSLGRTAVSSFAGLEGMNVIQKTRKNINPRQYV